MRLFIVTFLIIIVTQSCKKETYASTDIINDKVDTVAILKNTGEFVSGPFGTVTGNAEVYKNGMQYEVKLSHFTTNNGPALHVYLSKEAMPVNFIDLGVLKSTNGNQLYAVAGMPDFGLYKYVSIHCVAYNHLFGYALIK